MGRRGHAPQTSDEHYVLAQMDILTTRKRSKIMSTRHVSWAQNCQNWFCGQGSAPNPDEEAYSAPRSASWISGEGKGREREGEGRGGGRKRAGKDFKERKGKMEGAGRTGRKGRRKGGMPPLKSALDPPM